MVNLVHVAWLKEGVRQWNKRRKKVFFKPDLSGFDFKEVIPEDFRDSPKASRYFEKINLEETDLRNADLSNCNFSDANFRGADLSAAMLSLTNFRRASFYESNLTEAVAVKADFEGSDFRKASLSGAKFEESSFRLALLFDTEMSMTQLASNITKSAFLKKSDWEQRRTRRASVQSKIDRVPDRDGEQVKPSRRDIIDVLYSTNREPIFERGKLVGFSGDRSQKLRYGVCEVIVPEPKQLGSLGSRIWRAIWKANKDEMRLAELIDYSDELYWRHWQQTYARMRTKAEPTIFIHGFNNSFETAVLRAAKICSSLGLGQGIGLFSWPSKGAFSAYVADENAADASKHLLVQYLEDFHLEHPSRNFNIIAHSMGCRLLLSALEVLQLRGSSVLPHLSNVILVAADLDHGVINSIAHPIVSIVQRTTNYASEVDMALFASSTISQYPRVGLVPPVYVIQKMDTVIVDGKEKVSINHGYIEDSGVIADIFYLLKEKLPPARRHRISEILDEHGAYWRLAALK